MLDNTVVIYTSDGGTFWGEHRLTFDDTSYPYEPRTRVPLIIRYPQLTADHAIMNQLVADIDIAPTIYELANLPIPTQVDGQSLVPIFTDGNSEWRQELFITDFAETPFQAVHTIDEIYVEYGNGEQEYYDLAADPFQLENRSEDGEYAGVIAELASLLDTVAIQCQIGNTE